MHINKHHILRYNFSHNIQYNGFAHTYRMHNKTNVNYFVPVCLCVSPHHSGVEDTSTGTFFSRSHSGKTCSPRPTLILPASHTEYSYSPLRTFEMQAVQVRLSSLLPFLSRMLTLLCLSKQFEMQLAQHLFL